MADEGDPLLDLIGYRDILDDGTVAPRRSQTNFIGFTVADNPELATTDVTAIAVGGESLAQTLAIGAITGGTAGSGTIQFSVDDIIRSLGDGDAFTIEYSAAATAAGGALSIIGQAGGGASNGGPTTIVGGASGTGATGNGAQVGLGGGRALSTDGDGGPALLQGARGTGTGTDGSVLINLEIGGATPGSIQLQSDDTTFLTFTPSAITLGAGTTLNLEDQDIINARTITFNTATQTTSGATLTIDFSAAQKHIITMASNITTVNITNPLGGSNFTVWIRQNGTGAFTITGWPARVRWLLDTAPVFGNVATAVRILGFTYDDVNNEYGGEYNAGTYGTP